MYRRVSHREGQTHHAAARAQIEDQTARSASPGKGRKKKRVHGKTEPGFGLAQAARKKTPGLLHGKPGSLCELHRQRHPAI